MKPAGPKTAKREKMAQLSEIEHLQADDSAFAALLMTAEMAIVIVNENGRIVLANNKTLELFDYRSEELLGKRVEILLPEKLFDCHARQRQNYMAAPYNRPIGTAMDLRARKKRGDEFPVEISLSCAEIANSRLVMAMISDISERKQLEKAQVRLYEQRIADLETALHAVENSSDPPTIPHSSQLQEPTPLRQAVPVAFLDLAHEYSRIMAEALAHHMYKIEHELSTAIDALGSDLVYLEATSDDVVDLHNHVLLEQAKTASPEHIRAYLDEGHYLLVELLGRLATFYRNQALSHATSRQHPQQPIRRKRKDAGAEK